MSDEKYSRGGFSKYGGGRGSKRDQPGSRGASRGGKSFPSRGGGHGQSSVSSWMTKPIEKGRKLQHLGVDEIKVSTEEISDHQLVITNVRFMGSYNWVDQPQIAIKYPGMPPRWNPPQEVPCLPSDDGKFVYRDINSAYSDSGVLVPAVETLMQSHAELGRIDICADARSLGLMLDFARDNSKESWRVGVANIGGVIHLTNRLLGGPKQRIEGIFGYGHSFLDAHREWELKGSFSHQRMTSYKLAGLNFLVRYTADAYLPDLLQGEGTDSAAAELSSALDNITIHEKGDSNVLKVMREGIIVPQAALCDIKTRSARRKEGEAELIVEMMPRLWLRQIPHLVLAYHESSNRQATFDDINVMEVKKPLSTWVNDNKANISRFAGLLHMIINMARNGKKDQFEIIFEEHDPKLQIREQPKDAPDIFPSSVKEKWRDFLRKNCGPNEQDEMEKPTADAKIDAVDDRTEEGADAASESLDFTACDDECNYCGQCK